MTTQNLKLFLPLEEWYENIFSKLKFPKIKLDNNLTHKSIPLYDIPKTTMNDGHVGLYGWEIVIQQTKTILENIIQDVVIPNMQMIYYPNNGYMNWHTNSNNPAKRIYLVRSTDNPKSRMKFKDRIIEDKPMWSVNIFDVKKDTWHCVDAKTERLSLGFQYKGNKTTKELKIKI